MGSGEDAIFLRHYRPTGPITIIAMLLVVIIIVVIIIVIINNVGPGLMSKASSTGESTMS